MLLLLVVVVGVVLAVTVKPFANSGSPGTGTADNATPTALATVTRRALSSQRDENGTLGFAANPDGSPYRVVNQAKGTLTALPAVGQVVRPGAVLYRVANEPVVLLYGQTPAYRALSEGMEGPDIKELNGDLVALGYATREQIDPGSEYFGAETKNALERLQDRLGVEETGSLTLGQAVFLPGPLRITAVTGTLGGMAAPGAPIAQASTTHRQVVVKLDAAEQAGVKGGDHVTITMPSGLRTPGLVTSVGTVAKSNKSPGGEEGTPTIEVDIAPAYPKVTGSLDEAPVKVSITTASVKGALVVPVTALLALSGGGYAVEVAEGRTHRLVPVSTGLFDDAEGLVQVSGAGLSAGQQVVVPATS
jgi:Putative peptidoglycan binding domain